MIHTNLRRNVAGILTDFVGFGTSLGFIGFDTLLPLLTFALTGNEALVGLVGTLWIGFWLLPQLAAGRWMAGRPRKKPVMIGTAAISRASLGLFVVMLALGESLDRGLVFAGLVAMVAIFRGFDSVAAVAWFDIVSKSLPTDVRSRVFGAGQALANVFRFGASLVVTAAIYGGLVYPHSFAMLYGFAVIALALSLVGLLALREPVEKNGSSLSDQMGLLAHAVHVLSKDKAFRQVTIVRLMVGLFDLARPQYIVHATNELGLPASNIGLFIAAQTIGGILGSVALGRLCERRGSTAVIRISSLLAVSVPLIALALQAFGHGQPALATAGYLLVYVLIGALDASFLLGFLVYVLDIAPPGERPAYTGLANTVAGVMVIAPTIGGIILQLTSYPVLFLSAAMGGALALLGARRLPAAASSTEVVKA
ncbi:MAG TPA: MFS transporter [Anaerolineae bacterium]|nr:MFS transporter [Anaerolineae bacterium]